MKQPQKENNKMTKRTFEITNRLGEKFLMREKSNGVIETVEFLGTNDQESTICRQCNHSKVLHQSKRKGGCFALLEIHGYSVTICGCICG
jgi:hypothetical protein